MSTSEQRRQTGVVPAANVSAAVKTFILKHGEVEAARQLDVARNTVTRVAAGLPCRKGTIMLVAARVGVDDGLRPRAAPTGGQNG
jgi:hypothetical protein